jgi:hypothetical protein
VWISTLQTTGVAPAANGRTIGNIRNYNLDNLKWSRKAILNIISLTLWETIEKDFRINASGPKAFSGAVYKLQQMNSAAICSLVKRLQELSLLKEPGQDVDIFGG